MTRLAKLLLDIGLTDTETAVFDHLYHNGKNTASTISLTLSKNRATIYHALHSLKTKGLLCVENENGTNHFSVPNKEIFSSYFEHKEEMIHKHKKEVEEYMSKKKPLIKKSEETTEFYTGDEGIRMALEKAFRCKTKRWDIIAPRNNFFTSANEEFADYYMHSRKKYKILSRSLWEKTKNEPLLVTKILQEERNPRYLDEKASNTFSSILILYDDSALCISSHKERTAIIIQSESMHSILKMQFNLLYDSAIRPEIK